MHKSYFVKKKTKTDRAIVTYAWGRRILVLLIKSFRNCKFQYLQQQQVYDYTIITDLNMILYLYLITTLYQINTVF